MNKIRNKIRSIPLALLLTFLISLPAFAGGRHHHDDDDRPPPSPPPVTQPPPSPTLVAGSSSSSGKGIAIGLIIAAFACAITECLKEPQPPDPNPNRITPDNTSGTGLRLGTTPYKP